MGPKNEARITHFEKPKNAALAVDVVTSELLMLWVAFDVATLTPLLGNSQFLVISQCRDIVTLKYSVVDYFRCRDIAFPVLRH